jgi:hypothetical protein
VVDAYCTLDVLACRGFGSFQEALSIPSGGQLCLDIGDGVDIQPTGAFGGGTCLADGAVVAGDVTPTDPVTVCCIE